MNPIAWEKLSFVCYFCGVLFLSLVDMYFYVLMCWKHVMWDLPNLHRNCVNVCGYHVCWSVLTLMLDWTKFFSSFDLAETLLPKTHCCGPFLGQKKKARNWEELWIRSKHWIGGDPFVLGTRWMNPITWEKLCSVVCYSVGFFSRDMSMCWKIYNLRVFPFDIWIIWVLLSYVFTSISMEIDWTHLFFLTWCCWNFTV